MLPLGLQSKYIFRQEFLSGDFSNGHNTVVIRPIFHTTQHYGQQKLLELAERASA